MARYFYLAISVLNLQQMAAKNVRSVYRLRFILYADRAYNLFEGNYEDEKDDNGIEWC